MQVEKVATGIPGFDFIAHGGLPRGRVTLISGTAGSAKTVFATQFLAEGVRQSSEPGIFATFEESPEDIRRNMLSFGWDIRKWEDEGKWRFIDGAPKSDSGFQVSGQYDFSPLLAVISHLVREIGAKRLSLDSIGAIFAQYPDSNVIRQELFRIGATLKQLGVTSILTCEREVDDGPISRYRVEEFVTDNVIILRNSLEDEKRRRTLEILKYRGAQHQKGEFPFTIVPKQGFVAFPLSAIELKQKSSNIRVGSGNAELDEMCGGGFFRDSIILISGSTGTGKTLITTEFVSSAGEDERSLLFAFEESREQLFRNASGWGKDFALLEQQGRLKVVSEYPETASLEDHYIRMRDEIDAFQPTRVAVDSLSALERVSTLKSFREFVIALMSHIKHREITGLFTATTPTLMGGTSVTETHISTITDSIILLRYVEIYGEMKRGITVLKMRGSMHNKDIREFMIDGAGMHVGKPFRNVSGILTGQAHQIAPLEQERLEDLFKS